MKTIKEVKDFLLPLYRKGKPFIISEKDYKWIHKVLCPEDPYKPITVFGEKIWFDTLKTKVKHKMLHCEKCGKADSKVKFYTMTNDMQRLKAYHAKCYEKIV